MSRKWLVGCSIGCGVLIILSIAVLLTGVLWLRGTIHGVTEAIESHEELVTRHGPVEAFVPTADGAIAPDRMEVFLAVREGLGESQTRIDAMFADFPPDEVLEDDASLGKILRVIGSVSSMISPIGEYVDRRNRLLLEHGMGLGEYLYIYSTAYYSWLARHPDDGPVITKDTEGKGQRILDGEDSSFGTREVRRRYRRYMLALLRNQLEALPRVEDDDAAAWRSTLASEIRAFESDPRRVAWRDGVPPAIQQSLEPYRDRLQATYHSTTNCFELPPRDEEDWGRWQLDG